MRQRAPTYISATQNNTPAQAAKMKKEVDHNQDTQTTEKPQIIKTKRGKVNIIKNLKTYIGMTVVTLAVLVAVGGFQGTAEAGSDQPGLSLPYCESGSKSGQISMYWHTRNGANADTPDGWRVERRYRIPGQWVTKTWNFTGAEADALQTFGPRYWDWTDTSASTDQRYSYRVRALDSDGSRLDHNMLSNVEIC